MSQQLVRDTLENNDIFWQILPVVMGERTPVQSYIPKKLRFFRAIRQMVRDLLGMMTAGPESFLGSQLTTLKYCLFGVRSP